MSVYKIIIGKDMAPQNKNTSQCKSVRGKKKNCIWEVFLFLGAKSFPIMYLYMDISILILCHL